MKKFSLRFRADWNNEEVLAEILQAYFEDETIIKTKASLCYYLNISERGFEERKRVDAFKDLLEGAELYVRCLIEPSGFANDKSFAKFILQTQYEYVVKTTKEIEIKEMDKCYLPLKDKDN